MIGIRFDPLDTLFFRNGTPFARGSAPQDGVASLFSSSSGVGSWCSPCSARSVQRLERSRAMAARDQGGSW